jgi:hypothetical protein
LGRFCFVVIIAAVLGAPPLAAQFSKLEVIYPREGLTVTATDSTFIFGNFDYRPLKLEAEEQSVKVEVTINGIRRGFILTKLIWPLCR